MCIGKVTNTTCEESTDASRPQHCSLTAQATHQMATKHQECKVAGKIEVPVKCIHCQEGILLLHPVARQAIPHSKF